MALCPEILFVIAVELLACAIRSDKSIKGLSINSNEFKLSQYADDTTCVVRDTISASNLFKKLDLLRLCSGLELNTSKTEALWLSSNKHKTATPFGIRWPKDYVKCAWHLFCERPNLRSGKILASLSYSLTLVSR